jgi:hypothetical protein
MAATDDGIRRHAIQGSFRPTLFETCNRSARSKLANGNEEEGRVSLVYGLAGALVVLFVVLLAVTAARDLKSSPCVHRLRRWRKR